MNQNKAIIIKNILCIILILQVFAVGNIKGNDMKYIVYNKSQPVPFKMPTNDNINKANNMTSIEIVESKPEHESENTLETGLQEIEMHITTENSEKNWMDYRCITNKESEQYKLIYNSGRVTICDDGLLRNEKGYIGVALGSKYGDIGDEFQIVFDNGNKVNVFKVDEKSDRHTVYGEYNPWNNSYIEMVIDSDLAYNRYNGVFTGDFNDDELMNGNIICIYKYIKE